MIFVQGRRLSIFYVWLDGAMLRKMVCSLVGSGRVNRCHQVEV